MKIIKRLLLLFIIELFIVFGFIGGISGGITYMLLEKKKSSRKIL